MLRLLLTLREMLLVALVTAIHVFFYEPARFVEKVLKKVNRE